jgi:hypothetical protein
MAVAYVAHARAANPTGGNTTCSVPTGTVNGQMMLAFVRGNLSVNQPVPPSGWATVRQGGSAESDISVYNRVASSEPASYTFSECRAVTIVTYSDVLDIAENGQAPDPTSGATLVFPSLSTTAAHGMYVGYGFGGTSALSPLWTPQASMTERYEAAQSVGSDTVFDEYVGSGATGTRDVAYGGSTSDVFNGWAVLLSEVNTAPNAPLLVSPVGGVTIDRGVLQRFDWDFSDPDGGDSQSKYDLQYRAVGATTWTALTGTTPNTFHDFAAGTFAAGDYEWQVRTYDAAGLVGPYSASGFFTAATPPAGPTITDPVNGQTVGQTPYTVVWSYPTQEAYQLRTVADNAGVADPTIVYTDTGIVESTTVRSRSVGFPVNNRNEHVQVRVRDAGLWSPYTSVRVLVSYTPPAVPTAVVLASNSAGAISVSITNPTPAAGEPSVAYNDVLRRQTAVGGDGIRIAANKAANGTHIDFTPASGVDYEYAVRAVADNGTASTSAWLAGTSTPDNITDYAGY